MLVAFGVEIAGIVAAINGAADDVDVGFVIRLWLRLFGFGGVFGGFWLSSVRTLRGILIAPGLLDVFRSRGALKRDTLAVGRPDGAGSAFRKIGDDPGLAAREGENSDLRGLGLTGFVFVATADEGDALAIWRQRGCASCLPFVMRRGGSPPDVATVQMEVS